MNFSHTYQRLVLDHPRTTLAVVLTICGFFLYQTQHFKLDASSDSLLLENDADLRAYQQIRRKYPADDYLIVTFQPKDGDIFTPENRDLLIELVADLGALDRVDSVFSALDAPLFQSPKVPLLMVATGYKTLTKDGVVLDLAREEMTTSPLYSSFLVDESGRTSGILINFETDEDYVALSRRRQDLRAKKFTEGLSIQETAELETVTAEHRRRYTERAVIWEGDVRAVRDVLASYQDRATLYLGGLPMIVADMIAYVRNDLVVFGVGVAIFLVLSLSIIFRRLRWVLLPMATCALAGGLMIGLLGFLDWRATVISSNFVALLLIITMSMAIHLIVRYRELHHKQPDQSHVERVAAAAKAVALPCFYCALTTMVGFGSLYFSGIRPVMDFGKMMSIGIAGAYLLCFTFFPALLLLLKDHRAAKHSDATRRITEQFAQFTERRGALLLGLAVVLAIAAFIGVGRLSVENKFIDYFKSDTEIYQGMAVIDQQLGGTTPLEIIIDGEGEDYWYQTENLARVRQIHTFFDELPESGKVLSLDTLMRVIEDINNGQPVNNAVLNLIRRFLPADLRADVLSPYVDDDGDQIRIVVRIQESAPELQREVLLNKVRGFLFDDMNLDRDQVQITGMYVLYNNMLQSLFQSQISTIGAVFLATLIMFAILFRSLSLAFIAIIPNIFPVLAVLGVLGWSGIPLDMMTITIAAITIGIAVDHTIHYIHRFKREFRQDGDYLAAMHRSHNSIGKAMYYTSITIIAGFSIMALSNFIPSIIFGLFTGLAMIIALLGALTLLPALIVWLKPLGAGVRQD